MKTYQRVDRVKHLLQQEISQILQFELKDPRIQSVTVTDVRLTADLRNAKVLITSLIKPEQPEDLLQALHRATGYIRGELGRRITLKHIPSLEFLFDDSYEKQERILDLLDHIHAEERQDNE